MICLGIESSCDETALALVEDSKVLASVLATQMELHALFGGVVPELASREHYRFMGPLYDALLQKAGIQAQDIDVYAVSRGPGLLGALLVGVCFAKGLAFATQKPLLGINHLHAHLLVAGLEYELEFPALGVLVSGGHTHLYKISAIDDFQVLGRTLDDAAGEAFDKVGKVLGLAYPAGQEFDLLSQNGKLAINASEPHGIPNESCKKRKQNLFPRPYLDNDNLDFSFSGLKTAASSYIAKNPQLLQRDDVQNLAQLQLMCAAFTDAVVETLCIKCERALKQHPDIKSIIMAGGVAANSHLRQSMQSLALRLGKKIQIPSIKLCTDNAVMVAYTGCLYAQKGLYHPLHFEALPRGQVIPHDFCEIEK